MTTATSASVTPDRIFQFAWGYAPPLILEAAIHHRVFDVLDNGPMPLKEIAAATGASERGLAAILNALVGLDFLSKDTNGNYGLTPESSAFLVSTKPGFYGGLVRHTSEHLIPQWLCLNETVATGRSVKPVNQQGTGAQFFEKFVNDLFPMNYPSARALAAHLDLGAQADAASVLDLAAGSGVWGITLAQSAPQLRVTAVDWPGVLALTRKNAAHFGLADRFTFVEGDLLEADFGREHHAATLGHILHSEGVERSKALLGKTHSALATGGTVAIAEFLVNPERTGPLGGLLFAVNMLVHTDAGDTYCFEEISEWLLEAGFVNPRIVEVPGPSPLILATKS